MPGFPVKIVGDGIDWPAWVQAIGSIAAIVFAGMFAHKDRLNRRADSMEAFDGIVQEVRDAVGEAEKLAEDLISGMVVWTYRGDRFDDLETLLKGVPVFELGATNGASMVFKLAHNIRRMRELMDQPPISHRVLTGGVDLWIGQTRYFAKNTRELADTVTKWRKQRERRARLWFIPLGPV